MIRVGDTVFYGAQGVCVVEDRVIRRVDAGDREYLLLRCVRDGRSAVYVPVDNADLMSAIRPALTAAQANAVLDDVAGSELRWIEDNDERRRVCTAVIKRGDSGELIRLVGMLYLHRRELGAGGKRPHLADERALKEAERLIHDEFAHALGIPACDVPGYIASRLEK